LFAGVHPFSYRQVRVGKLLPWVTKLEYLHSILFWPASAAALFSILPDLKAGPSRNLARGFAGFGILAGVALLIRPLLPSLTNDFTSLGSRVLSLVPSPGGQTRKPSTMTQHENRGSVA